MKSASAIAHSAFLAAGTSPSSVKMEGVSVAMVNGYPSAAGIVVAANITGGATAAATGDFIVATAGTSTTVQAEGATTAAKCQVVYAEATSTAGPPVVITAPTVTRTTDEC